MKKFCFVAVLFLTFAFASCSKWNSDFTKGRQQALAQNKKMLLIFTGDTWSNESRNFTNMVLEDKEFKKMFEKDYVVVKVDIPSDYEDAVYDVGPVSEQVLLGQNYSLSQVPDVFVLSPQAYVMTVLNITEEVNSPAALQEAIFTNADEITHIEFLLSELKSKEGTEKLYTINSLYEATDPAYRLPLKDLIFSAPELDPENQTGLLGKFEIQKAYLQAIEKAEQHDLEGIENIFSAVSESEFIDDEQKQTALYTEAYVLAASGCEDYGRLEELLNSAIEISPDSENAPQISWTLKSIQQLKAMDEKQKQEDEAKLEELRNAIDNSH